MVLPPLGTSAGSVLTLTGPLVASSVISPPAEIHF